MQIHELYLNVWLSLSIEISWNEVGMRSASLVFSRKEHMSTIVST